jgi:response regulator RpfG family c-di-GMP phosphodiesterase
MSSVLVIDDEAAMRLLMVRWVEMLGHHAVTASSADEALELLAIQSPAVALCDLRMPGHDGIWLAERIRRDFPDTAVIMATAARDTDPRIAEHAGAVDYLLKPFGRDRLHFALERGFDWHHAAADRREWRGRLSGEMRERTAELADNVAGLEAQGHLEALLELIEASDPSALAHARRVSAISVSIGENLGLEGPQLAAVREGALLHDLGKLALPEAILQKPAQLSHEEKEIVRQGPGIGAGLLRSLGGLNDVSVIVRSAKEWYDGSGYPEALAGAEIPLGGRIVAVADAFDAMTRRQIYRDAMQSSEALEEIMRCSNSQFDPVVVSSFLEVLGGCVEKH